MSALDLDALERRARKGLVLNPDETLALITRLRAAEARTAWQPIESAPLGEWVLGQTLTGHVIHCKRTERGFVDDLGYAVNPVDWVPVPRPAAPEAP